MEQIKIKTENNSYHYHLSGSSPLELVTLWKRKDDNLWAILRLFYIDTELGYSPCKITKKLKMPDRTVFNCLKRLQIHYLITVSIKDVGPNKSEHYYRITEKGIELFNLWLTKETKKHLQQRLKI